MAEGIVQVGMDVHQDRIVCFGVSTETGQVRGPARVSNDLGAVRKELRRMRAGLGGKELRVYYEAGPCGYELYRALAGEAGVECRVVAPALIPPMAGDRVKTDRRDAQKLASYGAQGMLRKVVVPSPEREGAGDSRGS